MLPPQSTATRWKNRASSPPPPAAPRSVTRSAERVTDRGAAGGGGDDARFFQRVAVDCGGSIAGPGQGVLGNAPDAGDRGWGPMADQHPERQARILLGRV